MKANLSKEQEEYFNQIENVTLSICNGYRNIFVSKEESEKEEHMLKLRGCITFEQEIYDSIPKDDLKEMINYVTRAYSIWASNRGNTGFITDEINLDYQIYHNLFVNGKNDFWFGGMRAALIQRVLTRLIQGNKQSSSSFVIDRLSYSKLLPFWNEIINSLSKKSLYYNVTLYDFIIRNMAMEDCFWNLDKCSDWKKEFLGYEDKEQAIKIILNRVKVILDHLFSLTDEKMDNLSSNISYVAEIDSMILRGYNMLLEEESINQLTTYYDDMFSRDANRSNHTKGKRLIKKAFSYYQEDREKFLEIDEEK